MKPYVCVVGAVNLDICGRPEKKLIFRDSNPGAVTLTPGGVGRNIAHDLRLLGVEVKFLTAFGGDSHAQLLRNDCVELGMDLSCALDVPGGRTSTYLYITDERGEMQLGLCDTDISAAITPDYLQRHLTPDDRPEYGSHRESGLHRRKRSISRRKRVLCNQTCRGCLVQGYADRYAETSY